LHSIILAAGLGTRLRATDSTALTPEQAAAASSGAKAAMPLHGRLFLDYVLSSLADAGFTDICLVVRPDDTLLRSRYSAIAPSRFRLRFAVQEHPRGTADALLAAESIVGDAPFVVLNSDNYYPVSGLARLCESAEPATLAFSRRGLLRDGQIEPARLARYAVLAVDGDGYLTDVIEKPVDATLVERDDAAISMNVWRLDGRIFDACRGLEASARGELELPNAVRRAIREQGLRVRALPMNASVLDLSHRADVPAVSERLARVQVRL
jgi:glucose-1-phosphate thymidylyltransferase